MRGEAVCGCRDGGPDPARAAIDSARLAVMRHTIFGETPPPPPPEVSGRVSYPQLRVTACYDPTAFRAFGKINGTACPPVAQPAREQLLAALTQ